MKDRLRKQAALERERTGHGTRRDLSTQAPLIKYFVCARHCLGVEIYYKQDRQRLLLLRS